MLLILLLSSSSRIFALRSFSSCHLFSLLFDFSFLHLAFEVYTEFGTVSATVLNGLKTRGVEDIFIACTDNLTGFSAAIGAVFPKTEIQNCIIHQLRNSSKYVSYKDIKTLMADLRSVYAAVDEPAALDALDAFSTKWDTKYPKISRSWRENWANLSTYFRRCGG